LAWGSGGCVWALPLVAVAAMVTIVGLPLGLALLLAMSLLFLVGYAWGVFALGRVLVREPRSRWLALLAGWAVAAAVGLVPFLNLAAWSLGGMFGLGAMTVAIWRARAPRKVGRHRAGTIPREPDVMQTPASVTLLDLAAPTEAGPSESEPTAPTATTPATAGGTEPPAEGTSTPATPAYPSSGED
jgi:hypothetical protein